MTYRTPIVICPTCRPRQELASDERGARCPGCGGWLIAEAALLEQIRAAQPGHAVRELIEHNDGSPRRPCPACGEEMNIVWLEFLQLDRCDAHGVWLDPGELERALRWDVVPKEIAKLNLPKPPKGGSGAVY